VKRSLAILLPVAALALSACGLKGDLERPVPMWGNPPNEGPSDPRTIKAQEEEAARQKAADAAAEQAEREAEAAAEGAATPPASSPASPLPAQPN
jgi:hypothetical protein